MGDSKILLHDISDLGDGLVPVYFVLRQFRTRDSLGHDAVGDFVQAEEVSIGFSKISFVCIYFLDGIIGMTASGDAKRKVGAVMAGGRSHFCGENETVIYIHSDVLLETEVGLVILDHPVRFEVTGKLKDIAIFIQLSLRSFALFPFFLQFLLAEGMTGRLNQAGIDGYAFVDG